MFLLDTNVISELRKPPSRIHPAVAAWADARTVDELFLSAVTLFELELGVFRAERRDPVQGMHLRNWLTSVRESYVYRVHPLDDRVASAAARLHVPQPRPDHDAFIAATAQVHGLTVVTRNIRDFLALGVPLVDPWH